MKATRAVHFTRVWVNSPGDGTFHRRLAELHSSQHLDTELEQCVFECWPSRWMEALHPARENASQPLYFFTPILWIQIVTVNHNPIMPAVLFGFLISGKHPLLVCEATRYSLLF